jgi:hypothetical protein
LKRRSVKISDFTINTVYNILLKKEYFYDGESRFIFIFLREYWGFIIHLDAVDLVLGDLTEDEVAELLGLVAKVEDAAVLQQCSGSMKLWRGSGSADPCL